MRFAFFALVVLVALHLGGALQRGSIQSYAWTAIAAGAIGLYFGHRAHLDANRSRTEILDSRGLHSAGVREAIFR